MLGSAAVGCAACGSSPSPPSGGGRNSGVQGRTGSAAAPSPRAAVDRLTLRQQVGQVVILSFRGTSAPAYVRRALGEGRAAGVILFGMNVASAPQVRGLTGELRRSSHGGALVSGDQEGGPSNVLRWAAPHVVQPRQDTPARAAAEAARAAHDLRSAGLNVTLAPVADVGRPGSALAPRTFPGGPQAVSASVGAAVRAYRRNGVAPTVKHFPGLGASALNTDRAPATVARGERELQDVDLAPFRSAIAAGVPLVMASHALYPALDRRHIASQSRTILDGLLRRRMRFGGVIVTDSMEARAVIARSSIQTASERAIAAGADLLLLTGDGSFRPVSRHLAALARRSPSFRARLREAADRVLGLKRSLGLALPR
jgi:beta-N-acetylhexosaminidase